MPSSRNSRIRPEQRTTNDETPTLGTELVLPQDLDARYNKTQKHAMTDTCRRDYRCRIQRVIKFWQVKDPGYYEVGVRDVPLDKYENEMNYFYPSKGRFKEDIIYDGINHKYVLHFLVHTKTKADGKLCSTNNLRKYKDAMVWGSRMANQTLPTKFYTTTEAFLSGYQKEFTQQKKKGLVDDCSSDPITISLYQLLLEWALKANNVMVWHWTQVSSFCV